MLEIKDLCVYYVNTTGFFRKIKHVIKAVDGISLKLEQGCTLGLVGESGSGKSTVGKAIVRLVAAYSGGIFFNGICISNKTNREFFPYRKKIQMIFQDPFNSLNPRMHVKSILMEPLDIHFKFWSRQQKYSRVLELLDQVGLPHTSLSRYPHEFSGGQRQRIGIARALAVEPELLICDEPVSALDVSVQAQIVNLLMDLQKAFGLTYLFIAHDLAIVEHMSDVVAVMQQGRIVEQALAQDLYVAPKHPYTQKLLQSIPTL
ncbi:MAG: ATP-binding cassette domain-containing protein [Puniceicoccales bacterium]|jgi:peptide/nickel transport system ATP-binding protein/oligopeptide transport system ATP-binding protein|nr:ATP-binding cassette domain-containing protein [Puniceicoccales bacterium]